MFTKQIAGPILLSLLTLLIFSPVLQHGFLLFDDNVHLYENPLLRNASAKDMLQFWKAPYFGLYVPVTYSAWALLTRFLRMFTAGFPAGPYHGLNVLLHAANGVLVFQFLCTMVNRRRVAFIGATFFILHPVQ